MDDTLENQGKIRSASDTTPLEFYGIFGSIDLPGGSYLIVIKQASFMGEIMKCQVFRVESLLFVPMNEPYAPFTAAAGDRPFIDMI